MSKRPSLFTAATLFAILAAGSAQAFSLKKLEHGISKAVGGAAKDVGHVAAQAGRDVGHATTTVGRDIGHTAATVGRDVGRGATASVKFVNKEAATPAARTMMGVTSKTLDVTGSVLDRIGNKMTEVPVLQVAAPMAHDAAKAVQSKAAHYGAAIGVGLAIGGGALGGATGGLETTTAGRLTMAAGNGGFTGYYGRQLYLDGRCAPHTPETKTCTRLESKP